MNHNALRRMHPWGCPAYVLDPKLQDGKKLPKWNPRSRQGKFVGFSSAHASNVGLILNLATRRISPQYHVLFDDFFSTVRSVDDRHDPVLEEVNWDRLIRVLGTDRYFAEEDVDYVPPVHDDWMSPEERQARAQRRQPRPPVLPLQREPEVQRETPPPPAPAAPASQGEPLASCQREPLPPSSDPVPLQREKPPDLLESEEPPTSQNTPGGEIDSKNVVSGRRTRRAPRRFADEVYQMVTEDTPPAPFPLHTRSESSTAQLPPQVKRPKQRLFSKKYFSQEAMSFLENADDFSCVDRVPKFYTCEQSGESLK